jgi:hypothetical protein
MQKLLISAAVVTGLIAPAIFAAVSYSGSTAPMDHRSHTGMMMSSGKTMTGMVRSGSGRSMTGTLRSISGSCVREAVKSLEVEKRKLAEKYRLGMREAMVQSYSGSSVSGERALRNTQIKSLKADYQESLATLRENTKAKQRACVAR